MSSKIVDLLKNKEYTTFSFEVTPDISENDITKTDLQPMFYSVTWHATGHQSKDMDVPPLKLADLLRKSGKNVLLHLSCNMMKKAYLNDLLQWLQEKDICNLFIILGESFDPNISDFKTSHEMIAYIREKSGDYFCIGVAGFPSDQSKISALKEKIDNGADFVISQAFFESNVFYDFIKKCRDVAINVPIIPGIFSFQSQKEFNGFLKLCKVDVSSELKEKFDNGAITGREAVENLLTELHNDSRVNHFHFFTLNKLAMTCDLITKTKIGQQIKIGATLKETETQPGVYIIFNASNLSLHPTAKSKFASHWMNPAPSPILFFKS